ncbi:MAG TPA: 6-phospho-beta-glucosidase [Bacilli bacterium]|nr:MAG: putative 6-phospho-beta-glucosidase [Tenericutes bacterium ADurb.BinA124]HNZ50437.1 6-phospho-beta-glucosidase [Bacilli bacterium]HPN60499.1 6-phospho-beta-glucosidase [Bacilli bacterium]HPX83998.1 6-phospho-beta-glucosidase [Bacilli bacterium]HQC74098.1 6-phospho-beta-glucosidase [Bacilli bacterium]
MKKLKIALIGAGSTYSPELIEGLINKKDSLPLGELYLMDIDDRKLKIVGGLCERMIKAAGLDCQVVLSKSLENSLVNADFVLAQIRVGKLPARILDEKIPLKYDLIGQETNGIGGFFKGMRTIPVILDIVRKMEQLCPEAWLINFSNPSGMICEAVLNYTNIKMLGLCNVPINMIDSVKKRLNLPNASVEYVGLNHLTWITAITDQKQDYLQTAIAAGLNSEAMKNIPASGFSADLIRTIKAIPSSYLEYYYFKDAKLQKAKEAKQTRGEVVSEIEEQLLEIYANEALHVKPELLSKRGGARYSEVAINLVDSIYNDKGDIQVVNTLNKGAIPFMADSDAVEISAVIDKNGAHPIPAHFDNEHIKEYMLMMKAYEKHAVKAAISGDEDEAMRALLINPLVFDYKKAYPCFQELKQAHKEFLPQFFKEKK